MGEPPFVFAREPADALIAVAGRLERLVRAAARRAIRGERLLEEGELRGRRRHAPRLPPATAPSAAAPAPGAAQRGAILFLPAVAWSYRWQRPQQLAAAIAALGHPVLYVDGFSRLRAQPALRSTRLQDDLYRLELRMPGRPDPYRAALAASAAAPLARRIAAGTRRPVAVVVAQLPFWSSLAAALADRCGAPLLYDRIDAHTAFPDVPAVVARGEEELLARADVVTATSELLLPAEVGHAMISSTTAPSDADPRGHAGSRTARRALLLPNAVSAELYESLRGAAGRRDPATITGTIVGYVGALNAWFDAPAIRAAALARPGWTFRLAGRVEDERVAALGALRNVALIGEIPHAALTDFLEGIDVGLVPFVQNELTSAVDPVKVYEYLAAGLPVVARTLPALRRWSEPDVFTYQRESELLATVERALAARTPAHAEARRRAVAVETWRERAISLLDAIVRVGDRDR